jgi:hypothetical protein
MITVWETNLAIENDPLIDKVPTKNDAWPVRYLKLL